MVLLQIGKWLADNKLLAGISALIGSALGFGLRRVYDRFFSDYFVSAESLLGKLQTQTLSSNGLKRLIGELDAAILKLQNVFSKEGEQAGLFLTIKDSDRFFAKAIHEDAHYTNCPPDDEKRRFFYQDVRSLGQRPVYELKSLAAALDEKLNRVLPATKNDILLFGSRVVINSELKLFFWINASNYFPENNLTLQEDQAAVENVIQKWLPGAVVIIEIYVSKDIANRAVRFINYPGIMVYIDPADNDFAKLILKRNEIFAELQKGRCFGNLTYLHGPIPETIIQERLDAAKRGFTADIFNIYGAPGTGKTYLASRFLQELAAKSALLLVLDSIELIHAFADEVITDQDALKCYDSIAGVILAGKYNLMPALFTADEPSGVITRFVIKEILRERKQPFILVVDDYYLYRERIEKKLTDLIGKGWGVQGILIGRPRSVDLISRLKQAITSYECKGWSRTEALAIMDSWTTDRSSKIRSVLEIEWLVREDLFSTYLLRLIIKNMDDFEGRKLSDILRKELVTSLTPIFENLVDVGTKQQLSLGELRFSLEQLVASATNGEDTRRKIQDLLEKGTELDIDNFIDAIGQLYWASRFQSGGISDGLSNELIKEYLPYLNIVNFKKIATEGNIFKYSEGDKSLDWNDHLVADGCLSLLLRRNLQNIGNQEARWLQFSGMLEGLRNHNSLNILSLVLDSDAIIKMTKIIGATNLSRIDLIDELLTETNMNRLKDEKNMGAMALAVIEGFSQLDDYRNVSNISKLVSRLVQSDGHLKTYLEQTIARGGFAAKVAVKVLAHEYENNPDFYRMMDGLGVDKVYSTEVAISSWEKMESRQLIGRLNGLAANEKEAISELWMKYLSIFTGDEIFRLTTDLLSESGWIENKCNVVIAESGLRFAVEKKSLIDRVFAKSSLRRAMNTCWTNAKYEFSSVAVKYYVYFDAPKLFKKDSHWAVHTVLKCAIPKTPYGTDNLARVVSNFSDTARKYNIPKIGQLEDQGYCAGLLLDRGLELVSDYLNDGDIRVPQLPVNYRLVDFRVVPKRIDSLVVEDRKSDSIKVFFWRPVYYFD